MHDTVDQAHGAVPRTLADIIQGAFRPCVVTAALTRQPQMGVLILQHRPGWAVPGEVPGLASGA
jgi:hypothetical protein